MALLIYLLYLYNNIHDLGAVHYAYGTGHMHPSSLSPPPLLSKFNLSGWPEEHHVRVIATVTSFSRLITQCALFVVPLPLTLHNVSPPPSSVWV